jgi:hypothetical protein
VAEIIRERVTAVMPGSFVVFLIGMRINKLWKIGSWLPVARAMAQMQGELARRPELGQLHVRNHFGLRNVMVVQYWKSFEHLEAYAKGEGLKHLPVWREYNKALANAGDVGIWHETYLIDPGRHESVYNNMPRFGLGAAGELVPAKGRKAAARDRIKAEAVDE